MTHECRHSEIYRYENDIIKTTVCKCTCDNAALIEIDKTKIDGRKESQYMKFVPISGKYVR